MALVHVITLACKYEVCKYLPSCKYEVCKLTS